MSENESAFDMTAAPRPRRQMPKTWLIVTGVLIFINLTTLGIGKFKEGQLHKQLKKADAAHAQQQQKMQAEYNDKIKNVIKREGETLARSVQMVNPQLLTDRGQEKALSYFQSLLEDPNIEFIALFDANGTMCATTNLRLMGKVSVPPGLTDAVVSKGGGYGAGVQYFGPITRSDGQPAGTVLIGMNFNTDQAVKVAKPSATASEDEGTAKRVQPAPVVQPVPMAEPAPVAPQPPATDTAPAATTTTPATGQ